MTIQINSASDDRTANNAMRHTYRILTDAEKQQMVDLKDIVAAVRASKPAPKPVAASPAPDPAVKPGIWAAIVALLARIFGGKK